MVLLPGIDRASAMGIEDDPLLLNVTVNELEWRKHGGDNGLAWNVEAWLGRDLDKAWLKTEGETESGDTNSAEVQLLYSRAIAPFWDLQAGWRRVLEPGEIQDWLALSVQGLAPYNVHVDASVFFAASGRAAARLEADYDLRLTQRWILTPSVELNFFSKDDPERRIGSGLSNGEAGLRLRYEIRRQFAPYLGVHWEKSFGKTANLMQSDDEEIQGLSVVVGLRAWF